MGNSVSGSKDRHTDESVDFGSLAPQGLYTGPQDWNQQVVGHLIVDRKLAPFYRPLEEYDDAWDDDRILAARKDFPNAPPPPLPDPPASASTASSKFHHHRNLNKAGKEPFRPTEASVYRGAIECPICFLYYPPNINRSRCCDQAICTECFVQIKRAEPTTTHLVSEPASCPYCVQENFGVMYDPPPWRTGLSKDGQPLPTFARPDMLKNDSTSSGGSEGSKRRKSFGADSPEVVTIDQIRPDWEAKLAAVRAAVTRRANRRIIMRQVGDRLIPIGVTSGRVVAESDGAGNVEGAEGGSGRRRRRAHGGQDINQLLGSVALGGIAGQDLEELMVMEAMRLSLMEHEEQQRRQNNSNSGESNAASGAPRTTNGNGNGASPASSPSASPRPSSSPSSSSPIPAPSTPSTQSTPSPTSSRQSPPRSRFCVTPSPLGAPGNAPPSSHLGLTPPSPGRAHRRTGSNPGPPSSGALAAALGAAQTASVSLGPAEGRQGQALPRSAPQTRAGSPVREVGGVAALKRDGVGEGKGGETPQIKTEALPSVGAHARQGDASASVPTSAPGAATGSSPPENAPGSSPQPPAPDSSASLSEGLASEAGDASSRDPAGYEPLPSSQESSDPLLGWDKWYTGTSHAD